MWVVGWHPCGKDVGDQLCMPEANGRMSGTLSCDLMPYSAGLRVGVGGSTVIGWLAGVETKAAKWPDYVTSIARPRSDSSSDFRRPFLCMLHFVTRFHAALLCSLGMCKISYDLGAIFHLTPKPIIVKQGGRFRRLCPSPNLRPQQAPSP